MSEIYPLKSSLSSGCMRSLAILYKSHIDPTFHPFHPQTDGQTKVFNRMIVHILCMYNSKHPCTWDESLPYVQHSYNRSLHSSSRRNPFQVGLGFQPVGPIDVARPLANNPMLNLRQTKTPSLLNEFNTSYIKSMIFYRNPILSTNNAMINTWCHTNFRWEIRSDCICRKSTLQDPIERFVHFTMDLTVRKISVLISP
jgi:hypothetical protein